VCDKIYTNGGTLSIHLKNIHKYKWPSGHSRFRYKLDNDGFYRLQTLRYESVELVEKLNKEKVEREQYELYNQQQYAVAAGSNTAPNNNNVTEIICSNPNQLIDEDDRQFDFDDEDENFMDFEEDDDDNDDDDGAMEPVNQNTNLADNTDRVLYQTFDNFKVYLIQRLIDDETRNAHSNYATN
jgi:hypothetical protein